MINRIGYKLANVMFTLSEWLADKARVLDAILSMRGKNY
jgi:hypothetical protein